MIARPQKGKEKEAAPKRKLEQRAIIVKEKGKGPDGIYQGNRA